MASFLIPVLSTLVILILSYLLWKWHTQRNRLTNESSKPAKISYADMLKNRLRRFDSKEATSGTLNIARDSDPNSGISTENDPGISSESVDTDNSVNLARVLDSERFQATSSNVHVATVANDKADLPTPERKPANTKKCVTLSITDDDIEPDPVTRPLTSLEELHAWTEGFDELNVASVSLQRVLNKLEPRPRMLVCHDMKGGYLQDRFVQGYPSTECYRIYHWQYVDIFVYFSHNFITIPPPCWTNAAHKHGVLVLGTFITEWEDGAKICAEIFQDQFSYKKVADQLVMIAKYYGFEGWLINIENPIQPAQMNNVIEFMKYLTETMHDVVPGSLIIWYDSVTYKGDLKWQDKLNSENRVFFDVSDGIFLNYGWNQTDLVLSARTAGPERRYDVYVGVDVFGRSVFGRGGGGWNTNKATHVITSNDLSMALFAPGWVYEKYKSSFKVSQDKFWTAIAPDCTAHGLGPSLPFVTSFCQGYGEKWNVNGKVLLDHPWTHLSAQELQPTYINQMYTLGPQHGVLITTIDHQTKEAYRGGGCLVLQGSTKPTTTPSKTVVRLFKTDIALPSTVLVSVTIQMKAETSSLDVALQLHVDRKPNYIMLCSESEEDHQDSKKVEMDSLNEALLQRYSVPRSIEINSTQLVSIAVGQEHYRSFSPMSGEYHDRLSQICCDVQENSDSLWHTRYYLLAEKDLKGSHIREIRLVLMNKPVAGNNSTPFELYVGEIKIIDAVSLRRPLPTVTSLKCLESEIKGRPVASGTVAITLSLSWSYDSSKTGSWQRFQIYHVTADGSTVFLGLAFALSYVVTELAVSRSKKQIHFIVQAVDTSQRKQPLQDCPGITIRWL